MSLTVTLITTCPSAAVALYFVALFVTGKIHSDAEFCREVKRCELSEAARGEMQKALDAANARADAAVRALALLADAIGGPAERRSDRARPR
jgi:hypothetical protein